MTDLEIAVNDPSKTPEKSVLTEHERAAAMLQEFGLSESETAVYIALLEAGRELGGSDIAKKALIPRQYVYAALPLLRERGLVIEIPHGKQSRYKAVSQGEIEKIAKRKLVEAEKLVQELSAFSRVGYEQDFSVYVGDMAIQEHELAWVRSNIQKPIQYIIGGNTAGYTKMMGGVLGKYLVAESRKTVITYYLGGSHERALYQTGEYKKPDIKARFMEKFPQGVTHTVIRDDQVLFYSFLQPALLYVIESPVVAKNYEQFFLMLWEMAGEGK